MEQITLTPSNYIKSLKIVHIALVLGIVFFALISILLQSKGFGDLGEEIKNILLILVPIFVAFGILASRFIFKQRIKTIDKSFSLKKKLENYRSALILKFALIEAPSFFAIVSYLLTGDYIFLVLVVILIVVFIFYTPSLTKSINDLELSRVESDILSTPDAEIN